MSTLFGPSSASLTPVGMINRLYNGDFTFCPAGTEVVADGATVFVNWYVLTQSGTITASQLSYPEEGQFACARFTQSSATAQRYGFAQRIQPEDCGDLRTALFNASARLRFSQDARLRWAILASTAGTLDVVNDWNSASYIPGSFFISSVDVVNQGIFRNTEDEWGELPQIPYQGTDDLVYLQFFVWTEDTVAQNGTLDAGLCQIAAGVVTQPFEHRPYDLYAAIEFPPSPAWGEVITQPTIGQGQALIDEGQPFTDVASATTTTLANVNSNKVRITGTTTITSFGSAPAGLRKEIRFAGALTLTHNATSLILPPARNIPVRADDSIVAVSLGSGNWYVETYQPIGLPFVLTPQRFGAKGDNATDDYNAFVAMIAAGSDFVIPPGNYVIGTNLTFPTGTRLSFQTGAMLKPAGGVTLTMRGVVQDAPRAQIFGGSGSVVGLRANRVVWFGAVADSNGTTGTDAGPAINRAATSMFNSFASDGDMQALLFEGGDYQIGTGIQVSPQFGVSMRFIGNGTGSKATRFYSTVVGPALWLRATAASPPTTIVDFAIRDIEIALATGATLAGSIGLQIGETGGNILDGVKLSKVENVAIEGLQKCLQVWNVRQIQFDRCAFRNVANIGTGVEFVQSGAINCADMDFYSCEFVAYDEQVGSKNILFTVGGSAGIAGLHFYSCRFYKGALSIYGAITTGNLGDLWFENCQWDGQGSSPITLTVAGTGTIEDIHVVNPYMTLFTANAVDIRVTGGSGVARGIWVTNPRMRNIWGQVLYADGVDRVWFQGGDLKSIGFTNGGGPILAAVYLDDCEQVNITHNAMWDPPADGCSHMVYLTGASDFYSVTNNSGPVDTSIVDDSTVSPVTADKNIANNWAV